MGNKRLTYMSKENRDAAFKKMKAAGLSVKKSSIQSMQLLHPEFVEDYTQVTGIVLTEKDKGFGNTIYKTPFYKLYMIEIN